MTDRQYYDFGLLQKAVNREQERHTNNMYATGKVNFDQHKGSFKKLAWNWYHLNGEPETKIWEVADPDENGIRWINRVTDFESNSNEWDATADQSGKEVTVSYRRVPIVKLAAEDFGATEESLPLFQEAVKEHLQDKDNVKNLLESLEPDYKEAIVSHFPELA